MRNPNACVSDPNSFVSCPGEQHHILYSAKVNADGTIDLVESGKVDIKAEINSQREFTDIEYITRQIMNGDNSSLREGGFYGDMTQMPKTFAEVLQLNIDAQASWDALTADQKRSFDNDYNKYFATAGTEEWASKLGYVKKEEVKEGEKVVES